MTESIVIALLGFFGTAVGSYFAYHKTTSLLDYRLSQLENKVSTHNNLIDRMYQVEKDVAVLREDLDDLK